MLRLVKIGVESEESYTDTDLLTRRVNGLPQARIDDLMPWTGPPQNRPDRQLTTGRAAEHRLRSTEWNGRPAHDGMVVCKNPDAAVAAARSRLQAGPVEDGDAATLMADQSCRLQHLHGDRHPCPPNGEHDGQMLLRERQLVPVHPVMSQQKPAMGLDAQARHP